MLRLPPGVDDRAVADAAGKARIAVPALSAFRIRPSGEGGLVIGYGRLHESAVAAATRALAKLIREHLDVASPAAERVALADGWSARRARVKR